MESVKHFFSTFLPTYPWVGEVFVIILATLVANLVARRLLNRLEAKVSRTLNVWDDAMVAAVKRPLAYLVWVLGFSWAFEIAAASAEFDVAGLVKALREVLSVGLLAWFVVMLIHNIEEGVLAPGRPGEPPDRTTVLAIGKLLRTAVIITAALIAMQSMGLSVSGVMAAGGIGGIAIGFAAKDLLANFFGALMIFLDRPFSVGDWIRSPDKNIEGTVEYIGWRLTRIRTFDKRPLYVPNSTFTQISVENPSRMLNRRIYETIGLRYDDARQLAAIVREVKQMLRAHPQIDQTQTMIVNFNSFGPSSLDFFVYTFTKTTEWIRYHEVKQDVLLEILDIVHRNGADIAYPTQTLKLEHPPA